MSGVSMFVCVALCLVAVLTPLAAADDMQAPSLRGLQVGPVTTTYEPYNEAGYGTDTSTTYEPYDEAGYGTDTSTTYEPYEAGYGEYYTSSTVSPDLGFADVRFESAAPPPTDDTNGLLVDEALPGGST
ncbi:unnamed protein product [Vitrella brassicaformis CCMP3155]|uniref:Uncharacterized protein n=1 Tax=Vitrella brassicaformis (strain CCMP3155) TaxID=1169540 RepID=A0A0G4ELL1_VITBC|nr:unnamed protein product [Vitrella brassicaformis CCMP3155]|eukprot:CEL97713.1 unnamed protein product [Vitrella brassicaformis CCMP3155]